MTQVLIVDDHPVVLQGCGRIFEDAGIENILLASSFSQAFRLYRQHKPDVVVVDLAIGSLALSGLSFVRRLRIHDRKTPILVLSMHNDPMIVGRALSLGANGYVLKDTAADELMKAFAKVRDGLPYLSHELASSIAFMEARDKTNPIRSLTMRELQTLELVADGKPYGSIADELGVSYKTVVNTISNIKSKLGAKSLPELMRIGINHLPNPKKVG